MADGERLSALCSDRDQLDLHQYRYQWAAQFIDADDAVVDAACGTGYGRGILPGRWIGVDQDTFNAAGVLRADLSDWVPPFDFDVFVGLETIEHLEDFTAYVTAAKQARKAIVLSTPIIPTMHMNPYHLQDFTQADIERIFEDWTVRAFEVQWDPVLETDTYGLWCFVR